MNLPTYMSGTIQTKAYGILRQRAYNVLEKYDITPSHWYMLGIILEAKDGIRQADVAKAMNVKPPLITVFVKQLKKKRLIQVAINQFDTRAKLLGVTTEGKKFIKVVESELNQELEKVLTGLTEEDLLTYHKVLNTIIVNNEAL